MNEKKVVSKKDFHTKYTSYEWMDFQKSTHRLYAERGRLGIPLGFFHVHRFLGFSCLVSFLPFLAGVGCSYSLPVPDMDMSMAIDGLFPF